MKPLTRLIAAAGIVAGLLQGSAALAFDTTARAALVVDHATGTVLLAKEAETPLPPASMSKLMTLYMVFEALKDGRLTLETTARVSQAAMDMKGSTMFLRAGEEVSIGDLIHGVIVQSGNDACVVLAEKLAGSERRFAELMTRRARELGMFESNFSNSTGWPHPEHRMSARDLVTLARHIIDDFPEYYTYFAETSFTWDGITQSNRNPLLALDIGADGLKTGHTEEAGYGLVASAVQDGRRVTMMVTGLQTDQDRLIESERLLSWAFREFVTREIYAPGAPITRADVWLGSQSGVDLVSATGIAAVMPWTEAGNLTARVEYDGPLEAPIAKGDRVAELVLTVPQIGETRYPLVAAEDVAEGGFVKKVEAAARILAAKAMKAALGDS